MAKKPTNAMNDAKYGIQLLIDFNLKEEEPIKVYNLEKHLQHFPRERKLVEHDKD